MKIKQTEIKTSFKAQRTSHPRSSGCARVHGGMQISSALDTPLPTSFFNIPAFQSILIS